MTTGRKLKIGTNYGENNISMGFLFGVYSLNQEKKEKNTEDEPTTIHGKVTGFLPLFDECLSSFKEEVLRKGTIGRDESATIFGLVLEWV